MQRHTPDTQTHGHTETLGETLRQPLSLKHSQTAHTHTRAHTCPDTEECFQKGTRSQLPPRGSGALVPAHPSACRPPLALGPRPSALRESVGRREDLPQAPWHRGQRVLWLFPLSLWRLCPHLTHSFEYFFHKENSLRSRRSERRETGRGRRRRPGAASPWGASAHFLVGADKVKPNRGWEKGFEEKIWGVVGAPQFL